MHLAYSALQPPPDLHHCKKGTKNLTRKNRLRYRAYQAVCKKYEQEIAAIQQYLPGWEPAFQM